MKWFLVLFVIGPWQGPLPVNGTAIAMPDQKTCEAVQAAMTQPKSECWAEDLRILVTGTISSGSVGFVNVPCGVATCDSSGCRTAPCQ